MDFQGSLYFARDAIRFARTNLFILDEAPLQIYTSAIVFAPKNSVVRIAFENRTPVPTGHWVTVWPEIKTDWDACLSIIHCHEGIKSVAFSHDSTQIVSAPDSALGTLRIWNTQRGNCEQILPGHSDFVTAVAFSHDSTLIASASQDKTIRIWDAKTGNCSQILEGHTNVVTSVTFLCESKAVASASQDQTIRIWNVQTGTCDQVITDHSDIVTSVVFSYDLNKILSVSNDNTVRIWNAETRRCEQVLDAFDCSKSAVAFSSDLTKAAYASKNFVLRIWSIETEKCEHELEGHTNTIHSVVFSPDSTMLASASSDATIRIWNTETGNCTQILEGHVNSVQSVKFSQDSRTVISGSHDHTIRVWDIQNVNSARVLESNTTTPIKFTKESAMAVGLGLRHDGTQWLLYEDTSNVSFPSFGIGCVDGSWITEGGQKLLWIPAEFRQFGGGIHVFGDIVVVECWSGGVLLLKLSDFEIRQAMKHLNICPGGNKAFEEFPLDE